MATVNKRAGIATACALVRFLSAFLGKHRQSIIDATVIVLPDHATLIASAIDAIIATLPVFIAVCDAWENSIHG
jgi:hypothetical protein